MKWPRELIEHHSEMHKNNITFKIGEPFLEALFTVQALMLKSVLLLKYVLENWLSKQQIGYVFVFRQQSFADLATLVAIVTTGVWAVVFNIYFWSM